MARPQTKQRGTEILTWWVVLTGLWLLTLSTVSWPELVAAVVLALPCAMAARAARRAVDGRWAPKPRWLRWFAQGAVVTETVASWKVRDPGRRETITLPAEPRAVSDARQGLATIAIGLSPGSMVVGSGSDEHTLVVHRLLDRPSSTVEEVKR